jgi:hypothetical protein
VGTQWVSQENNRRKMQGDSKIGTPAVGKNAGHFKIWNAYSMKKCTGYSATRKNVLDKVPDYTKNLRAGFLLAFMFMIGQQ